MSKGKTVLLVLGILLLLILIPVLIVSTSLLVKYNTSSYEYEAPVERTEEYVMPDYPEVILDTEGIWQEGVDETEAPLTVPEVTEEPVPETEPAETAPPETVPPEEVPEEIPEEETEEVPEEETEAPTETVPSAAEPKPAETLPSTVNTPASTYTEPSNPDASFANSSNAISVYGNVPIYKVKQKDPDVMNILALGTDSLDVTWDRGRSDTMMVISYNKKNGSIKLTSLLRDSLVPIEGHGWNRLNTAYFYGGVGLAINTINQLYGLDIQNFVVIDFNGTKNFIDYIGGVDMNLTEEEARLYSAYTGRSLSAGLNHMDSTLAMSHLQNRAIGNDFGRTQRQRDMITAVVRQIASKTSLNELYGIVDYAFSLVKTNISATDLVSLASSVLTNASSLQIESQNVPFDDSYQFAWYNGMSIISYDIADAAGRLNDFIYGD